MLCAVRCVCCAEHVVTIAAISSLLWAVHRVRTHAAYIMTDRSLNNGVPIANDIVVSPNSALVSLWVGGGGHAFV